MVYTNLTSSSLPTRHFMGALAQAQCCTEGDKLPPNQSSVLRSNANDLAASATISRSLCNFVL